MEVLALLVVLEQCDHLVHGLNRSEAPLLRLADAIRVAPALGNCPTIVSAFLVKVSGKLVYRTEIVYV